MYFIKFTIIFLYLFSIFPNSILAQRPRIDYFNAQHDTVKTKAEASYYWMTDTEGNYRISIKYDSSDVKLIKTLYSRNESLVEGDKKNMRKENWGWRLNGLSQSWYASGQLQSESNYVMGALEDSLKMYHANGVLKRSDVYKKGVFVNGQCYDQNQKEITYFPFEVNPDFEGGPRAMFQFLADNIQYPKKSRRNGEEGIVYVGFVIDKTGDVVDVKVKRGVSPLIDEEAMRVVKLMPKWKAGKQDGAFVRVAFTLPIKFALQ